MATNVSACAISSSLTESLCQTPAACGVVVCTDYVGASRAYAASRMDGLSEPNAAVPFAKACENV